jgi:hypothetical protein
VRHRLAVAALDRREVLGTISARHALNLERAPMST